MSKFQKNRNEGLKKSLESLPKSKESLKTAASISDEDTTNRQGYAAYSVDKVLHLVAMLNTLKLEPQAYRSESEQVKEIQSLIEDIAMTNPYLVAQCIVWSRCIGEGMRSVNHVAAACFAPFAASQTWGKKFYGPFNKKEKKGGCIYRPDDMAEIKAVYEAMSNKSPMTNAMKKGFASVIENLDSYLIFKYKNALIDIINLCHPSAKKSNATVLVDNKEMKAIEALMKGINVSADTWEVAQSDAGQEVAKAVREGKLTEEKAKEVLKEAKNDNWESLIDDNKLGILAALRNLNNILKGGRQSVVDKVCKLVSDASLLKAGKIMPYQIDLAYETILASPDVSGIKQRQILAALGEGIEKSVDNLKELLTGRNLVIMDCSGSMHYRIHTSFNSTTSCCKKAALIAAMICKATNADLIQFGSGARYRSYSPYDNVFAIAKDIEDDNMGCTNLASAFRLITENRIEYDRIFILSDNECNSGYNKTAYKSYVRNIGDPYIYSIDLAAYGTQPLKSDKVHYFFGYGYAMFDAIATDEFNPTKALEEIKKVVI